MVGTKTDMAKVIIEIEDQEREDGTQSILVRTDFDGEVDEKSEAHNLGIDILRAIHDSAEKVNYHGEDGKPLDPDPTLN